MSSTNSDRVQIDAGSSNHSVRGVKKKLVTIEISDDDSSDDNAFHNTKVIPVKNRNINRVNSTTDNRDNRRHHNRECITDDEDMETTDDSFSPPTLARGLSDRIKTSSIIQALQPQKLFKLSSGEGMINPNVANSCDKKCSNSDVTTKDIGSSSNTGNGQLSNISNVNKPKLPPRRYFRWGSDKHEERTTGVQAARKRNIGLFGGDTKKRNIDFKNRHDNEDGNSEIIDEKSCESSEISSLEEVDLPRPIVSKPHKLMIAGVNVEFPLKPYPSQVAVMNALIRGCTKEEHALVESPTGSGKTLALLCGALAWQKQYAEKCAAQYDELLKQQNNTDLEDMEMKLDDPMGVLNGKIELKPVPKIYYGSRTHRQISQVVKELGRTAYAGARMTILSSRDFTCIQDTKRNKTELCNELLDPIKKMGCPYYNEDNRRTLSSFSALSRLSLPQVWDIEDFVSLGQQFMCCPYYAARNLMVEADIVFCPYNYLIDPAIRRSMQIDLKGDIVILDEAHNIEDICRDSASVSFRIDELNEVKTDCQNFNKAYENSTPPYFAKVISALCDRLNKFMEITSVSRKDNKSDQMTSKYWNGPQFVEMLDINKLDIKTDNRYKKAAADAIEHHNKAKEDMRNPPPGTPTFIPTLSPATIRILENIIFSIEMITSSTHANDYRVFIKEIPQRFTKRNPNKTFQQSQGNERLRVLEFLCMNPGVVFTPLANSARTIALASGTLAPTSSFSSELMTKFPNMLHANHVIPKDQVFVRAISQGPMKIPLRATYANINSWKFQDELGRVLLDVCETVPYGVLCFFSSYASMKNLTDRWKQNGVMYKIEERKYVMEEPRVNSDLAEVMTEYRERIRQCPTSLSENGVSGVILFAVFRGKVAEGIDFSDNEARCVMTIGIPYAVINDPAVELKILYNDINSKERKTLKGREWYTVQAYRALNQALGRCIRHKNDWGAILMVDDRFLDKNNQSYLPNWIKSMWTNRNGQYNLRAELEQFVEDRMKADAERVAELM